VRGPKLDGSETFDVTGSKTPATLHAHRASGALDRFDLVMRIDSSGEVACYRHGGILPMGYREFLRTYPV